MDRKSYWTLGLWMALMAMVFVGVTAGCHWEASLGLGTVTASSTATVDEWAQANFLKAVDDLIAKVPDPNKKDTGDEETEETADDSGDGDSANGG